MVVIVILTACILALGIIENMLHQRMLRKIPLRILVNGTRGKTTVTRMAASVLSASGLRTYAKTTGSQARRILPDGSEQDYRKRRMVSMLEQLPFVRLAARDHADAIVVECMAQRPENQRLMAEKLIRPQIVLITNAYVDHIEEIGANEEETVFVLAQSIPEDAVVITPDPRFGEYAKQLIVPEDSVDTAIFEDCAFTVHEENAQLVLALAKHLGIAQQTVWQGIRNTKPDIGMYKSFQFNNLRVLNAFAVNDPFSFSKLLNDCAQQGPFILLYNHRKDRAYRLEAFASAIRRSSSPLLIGVIGEDRESGAKYLRRTTGLPTESIAQPLEWIKAQSTKTDVSRLLCAGNIKGEGQNLLETLIREAQSHV